MVRIYTRTGDDGTTGLVGGKRVTKNYPLVEACGEIDELNAMIGVVRSKELPGAADTILEGVQNDLFVIGSEIATPEEITGKIRGIGNEEVQKIEKAIDTLAKDLEPLKQFILPGGSRSAAQLHLARAVARRTERRLVALSQNHRVSPHVLCYLNRLSDLCFVLARYINRHEGVQELHTFPAKRGD
ncbi:MAG: cob(I)yrinic acid a,c-diamide adenosyltransferase [Acidobacteria bacterium]|nr:cob(I)yrinic acid a,c-diamide adenosyltransferase [Acidobacteriota bacterium]